MSGVFTDEPIMNHRLLDTDFLVKRLEPPKGEVTVVLDTDTYNEIDDQFALAYAVLAPDIRLEAVYAAPFHNRRSEGPEDGMRRSYREILNILDMLGGSSVMMPETVLEGSRRFIEPDQEPIPSPAAEDLVSRALSGAADPLYVAAIGAPTNVASALLMEPRIREHIVVVWLGGQPPYWRTAEEFNLKQDIASSRILFDSGVPLVLIPCCNVAEHLRTTVYELEHFLKGRNSLCDYLVRITAEHIAAASSLSKVIWDISAVAWLRNPDWISSHLAPGPVLTRDLTWSFDPHRHPIRLTDGVNRDAVFRDLFGLLTGE